MSFLVVNNLSVAYGQVPVFSDLSLSIEPGRTTIMIGHNGAGKSTFAKALMGTLPVRDGHIFLDGEPVHGMSVAARLKKGIALVLQDHAVFAELSVTDNLNFARIPARNGSAGDKQKDFDWVWHTFPALREAQTRPAGGLSGGQQRMLAIAMGMMTKPRFLVLDEPSLGLSPKLVQEVMQQIDTICRTSNVTVLLIEQNVDAGLSIAQDVLALRSGELIYAGSSEQVRDPKAVMALL
jgi:branched-chain amino acid transport system ATP-binding protein